MRARCPRKTQHQELITGGDEIRFVASLGRGGGERDSVIHFGIIVIQLSVLLASIGFHGIPRYPDERIILPLFII